METLSNKDRTMPNVWRRLKVSEEAGVPYIGVDLDGALAVEKDLLNPLTIGVPKFYETMTKKAGPQQGVLPGFDITQTPQFQAWFGNSEVVDKQGNPLVVYHGTQGNFDEFKNEYGLIFFTTKPDFASMYSGVSKWDQDNRITLQDNQKIPGANIMPCYLKCEKLFDFRTQSAQAFARTYFDAGEMDEFDRSRACADYYEVMEEQLTEEQEEAYDSDCFVEQVKSGSWVCMELNSFQYALHNSGYDGIVMVELGAINYAVFNANQIKSATGNVGNFDPESTSITAAFDEKIYPTWIGVDLDGTLAVELSEFDPLKIGPPVLAMIEKVKAAIEDDVEVRVFTARLADDEIAEDIKKAIREWTLEHIGIPLEATNSKDPGMSSLWDDRARQVVKDEGKFAAKSPAAARPYWREEEWKSGEQAWFEYHCTEAHDSADADLWYRSHQQVVVLGRADSEGWWKEWDNSTMRERGEAGAPRGYQVRFKDGLERTAGEDELMTSRKGFYRPDPPKGKLASSVEPWQQTQKEYLASQQTGYISPDAYETYKTPEGIASFVRYEEYQELIETFPVRGTPVEIRRDRNHWRYARTDDKGDVIRDDSKEDALYFTDAEATARGYQTESANLGAFVPHYEPPGSWASYDLEQLIKPPNQNDNDLSAIQKQLGFGFTDIKYDGFRPTSYRYPTMYNSLVTKPWPKREDFEDKDEYYKVLFAMEGQQKVAFKEWVKGRFREYGYEPQGDEYRLRVGRGDGDKKVLLPAKSQPGDKRKKPNYWRPVGFASNEFGTTGVWVVEEFQRNGLGQRLLALFHELNPRLAARPMGQMTPAGVHLTRAHHRKLVQKALAEGKPVPENVLSDYPELVNTSTSMAVPKTGGIEILSGDDLEELAQPIPEKTASTYGPVYHGTPNTFSVFRTRRKQLESGGHSMGAYFTDDPAVAKRFSYGSDAGIKRVNLNMDKPLDLTALKDDYSRLPELLPWLPDEAKFYCTSTHAGMYKVLEDIDHRYRLVPRLKSRGYDGIIFQSPTEGKTFVVFHPEQIAPLSADKKASEDDWRADVELEHEKTAFLSPRRIMWMVDPRTSRPIIRSATPDCRTHADWCKQVGIPLSEFDKLQRGHLRVDEDMKRILITTDDWGCYGGFTRRKEWAPQAVIDEFRRLYPRSKEYEFYDDIAESSTIKIAAKGKKDYLLEAAGWIDTDGVFYPCHDGEAHGEAAVRHGLTSDDFDSDEDYDGQMSSKCQEAMELGNIRAFGSHSVEFDAMYYDENTCERIANAIRSNPGMPEVNIEFHRPQHLFHAKLTPDEAIRWMTTGNKPVKTEMRKMRERLGSDGSKEAARRRKPVVQRSESTSLVYYDFSQLLQNGGWVTNQGRPIAMHDSMDSHGQTALDEGLCGYDPSEVDEDNSDYIGQAENDALQLGHLRVDRDFAQLAVQCANISNSRSLIIQVLHMLPFEGDVFLEAGPHDFPTWQKNFHSSEAAVEFLDSL